MKSSTLFCLFGIFCFIGAIATGAPNNPADLTRALMIGSILLTVCGFVLALIDE